MKTTVLVNRCAGSVLGRDAGELGRELKALFAQAGWDADPQVVAPRDVQSAADSLLENHPEVLVAAGGDGTVRTVALQAIRGGVPLGVLPLGTHNHFARDLGMPPDLPDAVAAITRGVQRQIDLGEVNGYLFLNNSSVGVYPRMVEERDTQRQRHALAKWLATLIAAAKVAWRFRLLHAHIELEDETWHCRTPFVFVGNNSYDGRLLGEALRGSLQTGQLWLCVPRRLDFLKLSQLFWHTLWHGPANLEQLRSRSLRQARVILPKRRVRVAVDGEVLRLDTPLVYRIRPGALSVLTPSDENDRASL